jgi:plastocyanin
MTSSLTATALALVLTAAPCALVQATATSSTERKVSISNFTFSPATLQVPAGTTVRWINEDDAPHTVLGSNKDSVIRSPALDTNDGYSVVLRQPGTYHYFCSLHPHMTGTLIVK